MVKYKDGLVHETSWEAETKGEQAGFRMLHFNRSEGTYSSLQGLLTDGSLQ